MRALDERAGDDRAVLQHVLEIHEVAVVHVLGEIVGIMEMDDALVVGLDDLGGQEHALREVLGNLTGHIVALHGVDRGVLIGVLLLDLFVVALDKGQDLIVRGVLLALEALDVAIDDVAASDLKAVEGHDLILDHVLDLLDGDGVAGGLAAIGDVLRGVDHLAIGEALGLLDLAVGALDGVDDLHGVPPRIALLTRTCHNDGKTSAPHDMIARGQTEAISCLGQYDRPFLHQYLVSLF